MCHSAGSLRRARASRWSRSGGGFTTASAERQPPPISHTARPPAAAPPRPLAVAPCQHRSAHGGVEGAPPPGVARAATDATACNAPPSPSSSLEPSDFLSPTAVTPAVPRVAALAMAGRPSAQAVYRLALRKIKLLEDRSAQEYYRRCVRVLGQLIGPGFTAGEHDGGEVGKEAATLRRQDALALARGRHAAHALERPRGTRDRPLSKC